MAMKQVPCGPVYDQKARGVPSLQGSLRNELRREIIVKLARFEHLVIPFYAQQNNQTADSNEWPRSRFYTEWRLAESPRDGTSKAPL